MRPKHGCTCGAWKCAAGYSQDGCMVCDQRLHKALTALSVRRLSVLVAALELAQDVGRAVIAGVLGVSPLELSRMIKGEVAPDQTLLRLAEMYLQCPAQFVRVRHGQVMQLRP